MAKLLMAANPPKLLLTNTTAAAKISIPPTTATSTNAPSFLRLRLPQLKPAFLSLTTALTTTLTLAAPSLAEVEKASLFDFNLTLPIIAGEFLLLMVTLDKIYFSPLGKFMDERDAEIREKLASVKDSSEEVKQMEDQAAAIMKAARAEIAAALNQMKKEVSAEVEQMLAEGQARVEAELKVALEALEKQKEATILSLDSQIADLSQEIVKKVLPL